MNGNGAPIFERFNAESPSATSFAASTAHWQAEEPFLSWDEREDEGGRP
jgi:hypothetical protein